MPGNKRLAAGALAAAVLLALTTADAATAAFLRMAGRTHEDRSAFLLRAAKDSARLLADDGRRLNTFLLFLKG